MNEALLALKEASLLGERGATMEQVAMALVQGGWPVFPCGSNKAPLVSGGFKARSSAPQSVLEWWKMHPDAMPAIVPGDRGLAALDVDSREAWEAVGRAGFTPDGFVVETAGTSGAYLGSGFARKPAHWYIAADHEPRIEGVVVRYLSGYVIAPGARREGRVYTVAYAGEPQAWKGPAFHDLAESAVSEPTRLPDNYGWVADIMEQLPNGPDVPRSYYVAIAHCVKGALGRDGREIFLEWAAKYPGSNAAEDARVFDTIRTPKGGWEQLLNHAEADGVNVLRYRAKQAVAAFSGRAIADLAAPEVGTIVPTLTETPRERIKRLLQAVHDAKNSIDRSCALSALRHEGFTGVEVNSMLVESSEMDSDEGYSLAELLKSPELLDIPAPTIPYLVWPGNKTLLAAREKSGKSTLSMAGVAALTQGLPFLGQPTTPQSVLWMSEEPLTTAVQRAVAMDIHPDRFFLCQMNRNPHAQLQRAFARWQPQVVVIDTLFRFSAVEDENSASAWTPTILLMDEITRAGAGLLILAHAVKRGTTVEYRGSTALGGFVDAILQMKRPKENDPTRELTGIGRLHMGKPFSVTKHPDDTYSLGSVSGLTEVEDVELPEGA